MASLSESNKRLSKFKRDLVAGLFAQHGVFHEHVKALRGAFNITPIVQVPPLVKTIHFPSHELEQADNFVREQFRHLWMSQVLALRNEVVPQAYRQQNWTKFLSACLIYDPPDTELLAFADHGDAVDATSNSAKSAAGSGTNHSSHAPTLPIEHIPDPTRLRDETLWYYRTAIYEIGKHFLQPMVLDILEMFGKEIGTPRVGER